MPLRIIELKGSLFTLSVVKIYSDSLELISSSLSKKLASAPNFFANAPMVADLEKVDDTFPLSELVALFSEFNLVLVGITHASEQQKSYASTHGLAVLNAGKTAPESTEKPEIPPDATNAPAFVASKIVRGNVRSGQQVYAADTDLIITGSVSAGAEVIADGDIHVHGALRGRAIAGAKLNPHARIICQNMQAELISIAGNYLLSDSINSDLWQQAALVELNDGKILISAL
ncbi:septum site-determining protein MinC [Algicola sagamiensis]|uniref:septum site-determining protein MinC n=1 Tax=Algicola sagamiensis TaxID=163869 RepID=UPI0003690439|nr:septum site-determining protein MinC [Algicola sagamiensis]